MSGPLGKELTKFLKSQLKEKLEPKLIDLGFFKPAIEKPFLGVSFDVYSYRRWRNRRFAIWEIEVHSGHFRNNVTKLQKVLRFKWEPTVFLFHIFSPCYYPVEKGQCADLAMKLGKKYPRRFVYEQIELQIPYERFERMVEYFESNKYAAKQYYGHDLKREASRIAKHSLSVLSH